VVFALLGALIFALLVAPVLCNFLYSRGIKEWRNPVLEWLNCSYVRSLDWCFDHLRFTRAMGLLALGLMLFLALSGIIGSEFLPHLDEGAIWIRGTFAPSTGPSSSIEMSKRARLVLADFPEVAQVVSQVGRPDDGSDASGFYNTEFFVDLRPRELWRLQFHSRKDELIAAMDQKLSQFPGVGWNFSQPISDNVEEAVSGVKGELAVKLSGTDLKTLEEKAEQIQGVMNQIAGVADLGTFQVRGQPNINLNVDRAAADRFGINVSDVQDAIETAVGGKAVSHILIDEQRFDMTVRYEPNYRRTVEDISNIRLLAPSRERVSLAQLCRITLDDGASTIYREGNQRYIAIKYSVRGRDLGSTVRQAIDEVGKKVQLPEGYHLDWTGEYESQQRAARRSPPRYHRSRNPTADVIHPVFSLRLLEMGWPHPRRRRIVSLRRIPQPADHRHPLQRFVGPRIPRPHRSVRRNWRDHGRIHQPTAFAWHGRSRGSERRRRPPPASNHDDDAGRHIRAAPRRHVPRHRLRLAASFRNRDRRRPDCRTAGQCDSLAHVIRILGQTRRSPATIRTKIHV
jgi:AcrB/AcrD/AcrF family